MHCFKPNRLKYTLHSTLARPQHRRSLSFARYAASIQPSAHSIFFETR